MSSGGKNKRRYNWHENNRGMKRFHGTREYSNDYNGWDNSHHHSQHPRQSYDHSYRPWEKDRSHYKQFHPNRYESHYQNSQAFTPPILNEPVIESEEAILSGPGSETERQEKILATKKRLEEAFASKPSDGNHQEIPFQDSAKYTDKIKTNESILEVTGVDLRLTNSDFKEIGSVVTNVVNEGEVEASDSTSPCIYQQRSFDTTCTNPSSVSKSPRVGGWSVSAINEKVPCEPPVQSSLPKTRGEMYMQEKREKILGNVVTSTAQKSNNDISLPKQSTSKTNFQDRNRFSRVGRLYQSFLKSRLCGYTLKMSDKGTKPSGPNPLLDKSVLDNQTTSEMTKESESSTANDQIIEFVRPILVKPENNEDTRVNTPEDIAAEEANEFCKEFSFLLTHPNFLIPPEDLEKFGLGHLSDMTRLLDERRNTGYEDVNTMHLDSQECPIRVRSLNVPKNVTENDVPFDKTYNVTQSESINTSTSNPSQFRLNTNNLRDQETYIANNEGVQQNLSTLRNQLSADSAYQSPAFNIRTPTPMSQTSVTSMTDTKDVIVDSVVERVMEKLLKNFNPQLKNNTLHSNIVQSQDDSIFTTKQSLLHLQDIHQKLLSMYSIDKKIEELMQEKVKIYNDLLLTKEILSTRLNSNVQDQQDNLKSLSTVCELSSTPSNSFPETNLPIPSNKPFATNYTEEAAAELLTIKGAAVDITNTMFNNMKDNYGDTNGEEIQHTPTITPKLSVRKDLHDPNIARRLCEEANVLYKQATVDSICGLKMPGNVSPVIAGSQYNKDFFVAENLFLQHNVENVGCQREKEKKKNRKKRKKQASDFVIDLVNVTSDEEICNVSLGGSVIDVDPLSTDELCPTSSGGHITSGDSLKKTPGDNIVHLENNATCVAKMKNVLVVGCKEGFVLGFSMMNFKLCLKKKIHTESILCMEIVNHNHIMTASADSSIAVFPIEAKPKVQRSKLMSPVQCLDYQFRRVFGGTKNGYLITYRALIKDDSVQLKNIQEPIQLTNSSIVALKAFKEESEFFVIIASRGEQISIRNTISGAILRTFDWCDTVYCLQLFDSTKVYCGTNNKSVKVMDYSSGVNINDCQVGRAVLQIVFFRSVMFAACYDGKLYIYDVKENKLITSLLVTKGIIISIAVYKSKKIFVVDNRKQLHILPLPQVCLRHFKNEKQKKLNKNL